MFAKMIGSYVRQPLNRIVSVNHALIKRFIHQTRQPLSLDLKDTEQQFSGGSDVKFGKDCLVGESELPNKLDEKEKACFAEMHSDHNGHWLHQEKTLHREKTLHHDVLMGAYLKAVLQNSVDFKDCVVVDVGAGIGTLSLFAVKAGAKHVYAVEPSTKAGLTRGLVAHNPSLAEKITVIESKVEEINLPEKADILVSQQIGSTLISERMLKDYIIARDRFLKPNGKMFPSIGRMHIAPFTDLHLFNEISDGPVLKPFDPKMLVAPEVSHSINFKTIKGEDVSEIGFPLIFTAAIDATIHGLACCFDVFFAGSTNQSWLGTSECISLSGYQHVLCPLSKPIHVRSGQKITGRFQYVADPPPIYSICYKMLAEQGGDLHTFDARFHLSRAKYSSEEESDYDLSYAMYSTEDENEVDMLETPIQGHPKYFDIATAIKNQMEGFNSLQ